MKQNLFQSTKLRFNQNKIESLAQLIHNQFQKTLVRNATSTVSQNKKNHSATQLSQMWRLRKLRFALMKCTLPTPGSRTLVYLLA